MRVTVNGKPFWYHPVWLVVEFAAFASVGMWGPPPGTLPAWVGFAFLFWLLAAYCRFSDYMIGRSKE